MNASTQDSTILTCPRGFEDTPRPPTPARPIPIPGRARCFCRAAMCWGLPGLLLAMSSAAYAQSAYTPYSFSTLAGLAGGSGRADGTAGAARFDKPSGVAVDGAGSVYVADSSNDTIRKGAWAPPPRVSSSRRVPGLTPASSGSASLARSARMSSWRAQ
ncbi:MAG: hypothetical protein FJ387_03770 [Verrucomicrobia bacterium]|nr:hypothetical protein [Verrucomicrobiota bacterium]